ncbi:uncharacterized protein LOC132387623, partial [Hypanus sabinus]|uniref:uncharacterized protein LOC132387623 n=1 Tax=Hypanus sabinus TaxID=79690 RepID=UPI0028C4F79B
SGDERGEGGGHFRVRHHRGGGKHCEEAGPPRKGAGRSQQRGRHHAPTRAPPRTAKPPRGGCHGDDVSCVRAPADSRAAPEPSERRRLQQASPRLWRMAQAAAAPCPAGAATPQPGRRPRGRPRIRTELELEQRRKAWYRQRYLRSVYLGRQSERWRRVRQQLGHGKDEQTARALLDSFTERNRSGCTGKCICFQTPLPSSASNSSLKIQHSVIQHHGAGMVFVHLTQCCPCSAKCLSVCDRREWRGIHTVSEPGSV